MRIQNYFDLDVSDETLLVWAEDIETQNLLRVPAGFKAQVLERAKRAENKQTKKASKWDLGMQFFFYSLKIGAAAAMAVFLLLWMPQDLNTLEYWQGKPKSAQEWSVAQRNELQKQWEQKKARQQANRNMKPEETLAQKLDQKANEVSDQIWKLTKSWINKEE